MAVVVTVNIEIDIDTSLKNILSLLTRVLVLFGFGSELNKTGSVRINVTLRRVRGTFLVSGVTPPPPKKIPKALQNRAKLNLIVKTVKNC